MVNLWNPADEAQDFVFRLSFSGSHYSYPIHLEPRASRMFNISEVIQNQGPDVEGNIIPASVHDGGAGIEGSRGQNEHILIAMDAGTYNGRKATCGLYCMTCNGATLYSVVDNPFSVAVGGQKQQTFHVQYNTGQQYTNGAHWSSNNTSLATVGASTGLVQGVSPGGPMVTGVDGYSDPNYVNYWCEGSWWSCPLTSGGSANSPGNVTPTVSIQGLGYVYIGHDTHVTQHINEYFGTENPAGGSYQWSSSDSGVSFDNGTSATVHVTATTYSGGTTDTPITLNYAKNGQSATPPTVRVTKRLFYYLSGDSMVRYASYNGPSTYGYLYYRYYNVFTHPDHGQVTDGSGVGTYENVTLTSSNVSISQFLARDRLIPIVRSRISCN
jgi:hypothetical protein